MTQQQLWPVPEITAPGRQKADGSGADLASATYLAEGQPGLYEKKGGERVPTFCFCTVLGNILISSSFFLK